MNNYHLISILGAGGHGRSTYSWLLQSKVGYSNLQFVDPNKKYNNEMIYNHPIVKIEWKDILSVNSGAFLLGIGENHLRGHLYKKLVKNKREILGIVHNSALVGYETHIHHTASLGPNVIIGASAIIGANTIVNSGVIVEHECNIGAHCHLAPGVKVAGRVLIGDSSFIGIGAVIKDNVKIGKNVTIGAGAVVINDIPDAAVVVGVPAKIIRFE